MSGIEVAGLIFGVLPILIQAAKAYGTVTDGLYTFRHYSREVRSISLQLKVHNGIFLNHCRLLLRLVEDEKAAENMLEDPNDRRWTSKELNDRLNVVLKDSLELCRSIMEGTRDVIEEMQKELGSFDVLKASRRMDETIKRTIKRLHGAVKVTFNKAKYEKCLASLRDRNDDFSVLRSQISAFQQQSTSTTGALVRHKILPDRFQSIQNASQKLHESLCSAWCCDDVGHRGHYAKLCLDAEALAEVRLDLAISCHEASNESHNGLLREPPIWLYVQSMSLNTTQRALTGSKIMTDLKNKLPAEILANNIPKGVKNKASTDLTQTSKCRKKKRVHFVDATGNANLCANTVSPISKIIIPEFNLCQTKNMCHYLKHNYGASLPMDCLGYLETPCQMYKHKFYLRDRHPSGSILSQSKHTTVYSIFDIMRQEADDVLEVEDQLKLAHKTALAILQYNDTPWLAERWRLGNMSYFGSRRHFDEAALKTLHLTSQISQQAPAAATVMEGVQSTESAISDEIKYGINNLPLFFLGVALLEIAHWKPLESKMLPRDQEDQVYTARRLALGRAPLGPEYQKIVNKCIQCNFGFGTKLNSSLQTAVYNDVVCELEGMIERLAI
ncbi:hypothetical protein CC86DRAFT_285152 [Ophiobolus disseminans]|uniref:DUF7580 domain-containing protein n=1 Tax=Ophiobolus disseminans TaxID=1469910 RepID=A0A6A7A930_9PLEO|nr:hypothetical protein CC86DRAFT_285152 [Ophiobolus disseminans]